MIGSATLFTKYWCCKVKKHTYTSVDPETKGSSLRGGRGIAAADSGMAPSDTAEDGGKNSVDATQAEYTTRRISNEYPVTANPAMFVA